MCMEYHLINIKTRSLVPPPKKTFLGSTIRGSLGKFLKDISCILPSADCDECPFVSSCLYHDLYGRDQSLPKDIRFDIALDSKNFDFGIYVFGNANIIIRPLVQAIINMLNANVLTEHNYTFPNSIIYVDGRQLAVDRFGHLLGFELNPMRLEINSRYIPSQVEIKLVTPLILKYKKEDFSTNEEYLSKKKNFKSIEDITIKDILWSILWRKSYYANRVRPKVAVPSTGHIKFQKYLEYINIRRLKTDDPISGVIGKIIVNNLDAYSYEILKWGEILGVGKKTVFGAGKILLKEL